MNFENPLFNDKQRSLFLYHWNHRYPQAEAKTANHRTDEKSILGMIVFSDQEIILERNGRIICSLKFNSHVKFKEAHDGDFLPLEALRSGDWVECFLHGDLETVSKNSVVVKEVQLLSPNLSDKGHRSDVNESFRHWRLFIRKVEEFFDRNGFDFLQTPTLVPCPGTEPFLDPFKTEFIYGSRRQNFYLPTSPELHLKKCLAKGWDKIYEIRPCFRNGEISPLHQPEFYLLEWYRAFADTIDIKNDVRDLVSFLVSSDILVSEALSNKGTAEGEGEGVKRLKQSVSRSDLELWTSLSVSELFKIILGFDLRPDSSHKELIDLAQKHQIDVSSSTDFDEAFYFIFLEKIEPQLKKWKFLFVHSYPPSQAALARLTPEGWGDRFEFYIDGIEIANAFGELNNPVEQRARSAEDIQKKIHYGKVPVSLDEDFFQHLERGLPPSSGIALGLERLFMVLFGYKGIDQFRLFPMSSINSNHD